MKSTTNRYRPPRTQYKLDDWNKKKSIPLKKSGKNNQNSKGPKFK